MAPSSTATSVTNLNDNVYFWDNILPPSVGTSHVKLPYNSRAKKRKACPTSTATLSCRRRGGGATFWRREGRTNVILQQIMAASNAMPCPSLSRFLAAISLIRSLKIPRPDKKARSQMALSEEKKKFPKRREKSIPLHGICPS